jgi:hypothetical protein
MVCVSIAQRRAVDKGNFAGDLEPIGASRDLAKNQLIDLGVFNERIGLYAA